MDTYYKRDRENKLLYRETWIDEKQEVAIIHSGKVGYKGKKELISLLPSQYQKHTEQFQQKTARTGYNTIPSEEKFQLRLFYTMRSKFGTQRDRWLRNRLVEYINNALQWKGTGIVDRSLDNEEELFQNYQFTINCIVVDDTIGITIIQSCLKEYYLDYTKPLIEVRKCSDETILMRIQ